MAEKKQDKQRVVTDKVRLSYVHFIKPTVPKGEEGKQEPKYGCTVLFPVKFADRKDSPVLKKMRLAIHAAKVEKWGPNKETWPKKIRSPFRDGDDTPDQEGYKGKTYISARNKNRPQLLDMDKEPIDLTEIGDKLYSGVYAAVALRAFAYGGKGTSFKPGVSFGLDAVIKVEDGQRLAGAPDAQELFKHIEAQNNDEDEEEDDEDSDDEDSDDEDESGF